MSENRLIIYREDDPDIPDLPINFGTYALMMYYAGKIDPALAEMLYDSSISQVWYLLIHELPGGELIDNDGLAHFAPDEIPAIINFIGTKVIPALRKENNEIDLLETYGGQAKFYDMFCDQDGFLNDIGIDTDEDYATYPRDLIYYFTGYKKLLERALSLNKPYEVWIN